jgi:hypothetical protein
MLNPKPPKSVCGAAGYRGMSLALLVREDFVLMTATNKTLPVRQAD